jgi:HD-like signal output (HDOD) protein
VQRLDESRTELRDLSYFWRRSLTTAVVSSRLADAVLPRRHDEAFVSGLLADIGVVVLARALPGKYGPIARRYRPYAGDSWMADERTVLGVTHGEVSAVVLEEWSLPTPIVDAVRYSDRPALAIPADAPGRALAPIISCAAELARALCEVRDAAKAAADCLSALGPLELGANVLAEMLPKIEHDVDALASMLRIHVVASSTFAQVAEQVSQQLAQPTV